MPLIGGHKGFSGYNVLPDFEPERAPGLHHAYRRIPSALRLLKPELLPSLLVMSEEESHAAVRFWLDPVRRRTIHRHPGSTAPTYAQDLQQWVTMKGNRHLLSWWKRPYAWRSPREFVGYGVLTRSLGLPHTEPFEIAHFRLPDDISCDSDVVVFQAWCQGLMLPAFPEDSPFREAHSATIRRGLSKFARSPWVRFSLAAPFMSGAGIILPPASLYDSAMRMEYLIRNPLHATSGELEHILASSVFDIAYRKARLARRHGKLTNPDGGWYVGGSMSRALGPHFRRGGLQPKKEA